MAGEFAFSISLSFCLLFLGVVGRGMENGRHRALAAVLLALTGLTHLIPFLFAIGAACVWFVVSLARRSGTRTRLWWLLGAGPVGVALTAWWFVPFYLRSPYMNDMGWEKRETYLDLLFRRENLDSGLVDAPRIEWVLVLALLGVVMSIAWKRRVGGFLVVTAVAVALAFWLVPQGRLWNARLLPFWYLSLYLLAALGIAELGRTDRHAGGPRPRTAGAGITVFTAVAGDRRGDRVVGDAAAGDAGGHVAGRRELPVGPVVDHRPQLRGVLGALELQWLREQARVPRVPGDRVDDGRARPYRRVRPGHVGARGATRPLRHPDGADAAAVLDRRLHRLHGGPVLRVVLDDARTTSSCRTSSRPRRPTPSATCPTRRGRPPMPSSTSACEHMQLLGVRYYMAISDRMIDLARAHPDLDEVATSGPWVVFSVLDSETVVALDNEPVVLTGTDASHGWLDAVVPWYENPDQWSVFLAADGPQDWARIGAGGVPGGGAHHPGGGHRHRAGHRHHLVPGEPAGDARAGQDLVLPELEGRGRRRALAGEPEPHGGGPDRRRGDAQLRHDPGRLARVGPSRRSGWSGSSCWSGPDR